MTEKPKLATKQIFIAEGSAQKVTLNFDLRGNMSKTKEACPLQWLLKNVQHEDRNQE